MGFAGLPLAFALAFALALELALARVLALALVLGRIRLAKSWQTPTT